MSPGNATSGYQSYSGASLGRYIQLGDSGERYLGLQMALGQHQSLTVIRGYRQPIALLKGFQKIYACLGLTPLSEELSSFSDMLPEPSPESLSPGYRVPEMPLPP